MDGLKLYNDYRASGAARPSAWLSFGSLGIFQFMANPQLTPEQRDTLFAPMFLRTKQELERLAGGDSRLLWALRRKLTKELMYLERSTPAARTKLKMKKWIEQRGICPVCSELLPEKNADLDRIEAFLGYTPENTRLVHHECHIQEQKKKKYA